jgi:hypothetical protein
LLEQGNAGEFPRPLEEDDEFYRAIHPDWIKDGGGISSAAFSNATGTDRMSVDWADGSTPQQTFDRCTKWGNGRGVALITAGLCWNNGQKVEYTRHEDNNAHSDVVGSKSLSVRKTFARGAKLVIPAPLSTTPEEL